MTNETKHKELDTKHSILLFDGVCNLCNGFIQFVIKRDPNKHFRFASLQSTIGQEMLSHHNIPTDSLDTVVLIQSGKAYTHSDVALRVALKLGWLWPMTYILVLIPSFIRDRFYTWIAKNRYRWFGKKDQCMIPTPALRERFLDN